MTVTRFAATNDVKLERQVLTLLQQKRRLTRIDLAAELGVQADDIVFALTKLTARNLCFPHADLKYAHLPPLDRPWVYDPGRALKTPRTVTG